jgi:putative transposase
MPRRPRIATGGYIYHVLNRAVGRATIFHKDGDYAAFERVLRQAKDHMPMRLLAFCLMPNHFHLVVWPYQDGELSGFLHWLTLTHTMRWHAHYHSSGTGPLYQGRFKSFPVEEDEHLVTVCRYVERNPLRAQLVTRAEQWPWSSLARRVYGGGVDILDAWPLPMSVGWLDRVNAVETAAELAALRRGAPFGSVPWQQETAQRLGLESTLKPLGRPRKRKLETPSSASLFDTSS